MPVHRVEKRERWFELGVGFDDGRFEWRRIEPAPPVGSALTQIESRLGAFAAGYRSEINLNLRPWMQALAESCGRAALLIVDYGYEQPEYYHPSRSAGTLICHYRHRVHDDPLIYPGLQDITAFVDFDAVADAGEAAGFDAIGLVTQAEFLLANGLLEAAGMRAATADDRGRIGLAQQVRTLTLPQEMGDKFKVLAMQKGLDLDMPAMRRGAAYG
jgi:SAM-dependent MidA family methyltransferase